MSREEIVSTGRRPTPLDPYPDPRPSEEGGDEKAYPPELGTDAIAVLEGARFLLSDALGDVPAGSVGGLVHDDTRFLNRWEVRLEGRSLSLLKSRAVDYYSAAFYLTNPEIEGLRPNTIAVRRFRFVGNGLLEQLAAVNAGLETARFDGEPALVADAVDGRALGTAIRAAFQLPEERVRAYRAAALERLLPFRPEAVQETVERELLPRLLG